MLSSFRDFVIGFWGSPSKTDPVLDKLNAISTGYVKSMVIAIIKFNALSEKRLEFKQSLLAMIEPTRDAKGCLSHSFFQDIENDDEFSLIQMWQSRDDWDAYLRSDLFTVLIGTRYLLSRPSELSVNDVTHASEWENTEAVRG